ncbi:MAG: class I SAM-dependent methyltransferase [Candidatus Pacebacteria bacterium]|nr:class I SAM-dependent methyltransferase [Candidatus Paceibacterota bacterium]MBP9840548.1 class I SAM-dependent methyltransferase [Candidatus Paceibacterota bacterium]
MLLPNELKVFEVFERMGKEANTEESDIWADGFTKPLFRGLRPEDGLIDIGCGHGRLVPILPDLCIRREQYLGIDFSPEQIALARRLYPKHRFEVRTIYELSTSYPGRFGGFWLGATLMLLPRERVPEALRSIRGALKPGARGFISTPLGDHDGEVGDGITIALYEIHEIKQMFSEAMLEPDIVFSPDDFMILGSFTAA